jgi:IS1 family transposase/transposase-like protein
MTDYTKFACPNASCSFYAQCNSGNIAHRSWTGRDRSIQRLRCTQCGKEFSERKATLMENSKISDKTHEQLLKCMRWGVCDEGIADICDVSIKTVRLNQAKAASRAVKHQDSKIQGLEDAGTQLDEMHCKVTKDRGFWLGTAIAMQSLLIVAVTFGERNQGMADRLLAEVCLRFKVLLSIFTDGWRPYLNAILRAFGKIYQPRHKSGRGRPPGKRLRLPNLFYGQVVKIRDEALRLMGVEHRALIGKMKDIIFFIKTYTLGNKVHTIHMERWYGTLRCCLACCRRRSRCLSKNRERQKQKIWIYIDLYNWVITHGSLMQDKIKRTPAMAACLIDHPISYREYIWLPVYDDYKWREKLSKKVREMNSEEMLGASRRVKIKPEKTVVMQTRREAA